MPLYRRLPKGPHGLGRREVRRNQRLRMFGALMEAVAANGYTNTSVKQVIGLAGVSRRSFYEEFASKEECFLATFDLFASRGIKRIGQAARSIQGGDLRAHVRVAVDAFAEGVRSNPKCSRVVIVEAQTAGAGGVAGLRRALGAVERMLAQGCARAPGMQELPAPVVRGIVGGLYEMVYARLRERRPEQVRECREALVDWALLFDCPAIPRMSRCLAARARAMSPELCSGSPDGRANGRAPGDHTNGHTPSGVSDPPGDEPGPPSGRLDVDVRQRLLDMALELSVEHGYHEISAPQIYQEAGLSIDEFFKRFDSKEECFLVAFDQVSDRLLATVAADRPLTDDEWPQTVRAALGRLARLLTEHPDYAQAIVREAPGASPRAHERACDLAHALALLLTEAAPQPPANPLALQGVTGAIWHTIRCHAVADQVQLLPALTDHLAYVVLTPYIGPHAAAQAVIAEDRPVPRIDP